jgi:hypothetical protein
MWLGHKWGLAPKIAWNPEHFFRFRKAWLTTAVSPPIFYHKLAPLLIAIAGPNGELSRVNANGGLHREGWARYPDMFLDRGLSK